MYNEACLHSVEQVHADQPSALGWHSSFPVTTPSPHMTTRELEDWLRTQTLPPLAAAALGAPERPTSAPQLQLGSTWQRVSLLPGLERHISRDASAAVLRAARQIYAEYVGAPAAASDSPPAAS